MSDRTKVLGLHHRAEQLHKDCGAGKKDAPGFQSGNTCAGKGVKTSARKKRVKTLAVQAERAYRLKAAELRKLKGLAKYYDNKLAGQDPLKEYLSPNREEFTTLRDGLLDKIPAIERIVESLKTAADDLVKANIEEGQRIRAEDLAEEGATLKPGQFTSPELFLAELGRKRFDERGFPTKAYDAVNEWMGSIIRSGIHDWSLVPSLAAYKKPEELQDSPLARAYYKKYSDEYKGRDKDTLKKVAALDAEVSKLTFALEVAIRKERNAETSWFGSEEKIAQARKNREAVERARDKADNALNALREKTDFMDVRLKTAQRQNDYDMLHGILNKAKENGGLSGDPKVRKETMKRILGEDRVKEERKRIALERKALLADLERRRKDKQELPKALLARAKRLREMQL